MLESFVRITFQNPLQDVLDHALTARRGHVRAPLGSLMGPAPTAAAGATLRPDHSSLHDPITIRRSGSLAWERSSGCVNRFTFESCNTTADGGL